MMTFDDRLGSIDESEAVELATKITLDEFFEEMTGVFDELDNDVSELFDRVAVWGRAVTLRGIENPQMEERIENLFNRLDSCSAYSGDIQQFISEEQERLP